MTKSLKEIFARVWAVWTAIAFVVTILFTCLAILICNLWKEPRRSDLTYIVYRRWMNLFLPLVGIFLRIKGKENFKSGMNYIVVCNHHSFIDAPITSTQIQGPNKTIAKIEMSRIPIFGVVYKSGSILVDRKDNSSRKNSYLRMKWVLDNGMHMCIYPEGTRNKTGKPLGPFQNGAFKLAVDTKKEILPALLIGTDRIMPNDKFFYFLPGIIAMHFLPAIPQNEDAESLKEKTFKQMWDYLVKMKKVK